MKKQIDSRTPELPETQHRLDRNGSFDEQARMVLVIGAILLTALGTVIYAFVHDPTVLVTNQAMTFIIGYYFHNKNR